MDLIGDCSQPSVLALEMVSLVTGIVRQFLHGKHLPVTVVIGHAKILDAVFKFFKIAERDSNEVMCDLWRHRGKHPRVKNSSSVF